MSARIQLLIQRTADNPGEGSDLYVSTSSAGGGLQMMVAGVVASMTGESAQRCALGAGAIVMDVLASNDGRLRLRDHAFGRFRLGDLRQRI